jgi:8-amino-7-oxononanoate synthase
MHRKPRSLATQVKDKLIQKGLEKRLEQLTRNSSSTISIYRQAIPESFNSFDQQPGYQQVRLMRDGAQRLGLKSPFFLTHSGTASAHTAIGNRTLINYASYNYLGLSGDRRVNAAAKSAIDQYGTSVSASRIVAGERPIHRELEKLLAAVYGVDDALVMVSGHATNVSVIGHLLGPKDLVIHDEYAHNSILLGIQLSGAQRRSFRHNDLESLTQLLERHRHEVERLLIVVEGVYSMDGDFPDLPALIKLKKAYGAWLMIDEAHSFGVLGARGFGLWEHFQLDAKDVDIWMGTLSKTLASCGGYVAGEQALIDNLRYLAPGFLYSVGISPPVAAAAHKALQILMNEPERVATLRSRGKYFLQRLQALGLNVGSSAGLAITPIIFGSSLESVRFASALLEQGIHVQPILYPAVPERQARLRFFLSSEHSVNDLDTTIDAIQRML